MAQVIHALGTDDRHCFFWAVHAGAEVDLVIEDGKRLLGFEFKRTLSPKVTLSMTRAVGTLKLSQLTVVYPGHETFPLAESIVVKPLRVFSD